MNKLACLGALLLLAGAVRTAQAGGHYYPCPCGYGNGYGSGYTMPPQVPVMPYGGGWGGPAPWMTQPMPPPFPPFSGMLPAPPQADAGGGGGAGGFPQHPYARSPRDYFMYYDRDNNGSRP